LVGHETFAERFDDRDAAANAGFVVEARAVFGRCGKQFLAVRGEQRFVRGDDGFALFERGEDDGFGEAGAADEFDDDVRFRIVDDFLPIGREQRTGKGMRACFIEGFDGDFAQGDFNAEPVSNEIAVSLERVENAAANSSGANHSKIHLLHWAQRVPGKGSGNNHKRGERKTSNIERRTSNSERRSRR
jgi:hypothetical protein